MLAACARTLRARVAASSAIARAREMATTGAPPRAPAHLCVVTSEALLGSNTLRRIERECADGAFASVTVGSAREDFERVLSDGRGESIAMLWWFANRELTEGFAKDARVLERKTWTHSGSAGVDHLLAIPALREHSSVMTNGRGAFSASLGEWGVFACMHFAKGVDIFRNAQREGKWIRRTVGMIEGKRMCVVGYGDIGQHVARRAKAMGMRVSAVRRFPEKTSPNDDSVEKVLAFNAIKEAVSDADYVIVALPSTDETKNFIDAGVLGAMKNSAVIVNLGRGSTVDEPALVEALKSKTIAGAALDVFAVEPLPKNHPFYEMENVLMSFHCADLTDDYHDLAMDCFVKHAEQFATGAPFTNVVDKSLGY